MPFCVTNNNLDQFLDLNFRSAIYIYIYRCICMSIVEKFKLERKMSILLGAPPWIQISTIYIVGALYGFLLAFSVFTIFTTPVI